MRQPLFSNKRPIRVFAWGMLTFRDSRFLTLSAIILATNTVPNHKDHTKCSQDGRTEARQVL